MSLFDGPAVIEAATHAACEATGLPFDGDYDRGESIALDILTAALAALDREALIEKMVAHMAMCDTFQQSWFHYRHHAEKALVDCGLIPDPPEAT